MDHLKPIINIAEICSRKGIKNFVISPGSRSAPLTLSLTRHPDLDCKIVTDERSAAFIALGIAQKTQSPVGLVCTSGTAVLNYAPAITEAFYQKIPLLVFTADRPTEWIDQFDNQSIRQKDIYGKHVLGSFETPLEFSNSDSKWFLYRTISEAINLSTYPVKGPVHINVPLREPLYPEVSEFEYDKDIKIINIEKPSYQLPESQLNNLLDSWNSAKKKLIVVGSCNLNTETKANLTNIHEKNKSVIVLNDITSNLFGSENIAYHDIILNSSEESIKDLTPDILVTFGGTIVSKSLKEFLRKNKPTEHWHITTGGLVGDTFQSLTRIIYANDEVFTKEILQKQKAVEFNYFEKWKFFEEKAKNLLETFLEMADFSEILAMNYLIKSLPENLVLHLGNSMPVRYASYLTITNHKKDISVFSNRGTSGIDGVLSTAVGSALATEKLVLVILGDLSFFYDRNALWHNYSTSNLRIVVFNNHGGGIFKLLDGSKKQPELKQFFETDNKLKLANTAKDFNLEYLFADTKSSLEEVLKLFFEKSENGKILEITFDSDKNSEEFKRFKSFI